VKCDEHGNRPNYINLHLVITLLIKDKRQSCHHLCVNCFAILVWCTFN